MEMLPRPLRHLTLPGELLLLTLGRLATVARLVMLLQKRLLWHLGYVMGQLMVKLVGQRLFIPL
jgi:hypothetical protein